MNDMTGDIAEGVISRVGQAQAQPGNTIGKLLLEAGKITPVDAEKIIKLQHQKNLRFGEAAIELGLVKQEDIQYALAQQFDYPYLMPGQGNFSPELVAAYYPYSEQVESLRALRTQLLLRWFHTGHKFLSFTSGNGHEGTSYQVANLAVVFSQLGERTLLVDANLRQPRQHHIFNLGNRAGLSEMLAGRADNAIYKIPSFVDLSVLPAGTVPPNPAELLARNTFGGLLQTLAERFDIILIDTPALSSYADAQNIAAMTGGSVLVVRQDHTRLAQLQAAQKMLQSTGAELVGAVLNRY